MDHRRPTDPRRPAAAPPSSWIALAACVAGVGGAAVAQVAAPAAARPAEPSSVLPGRPAQAQPTSIDPAAPDAPAAPTAALDLPLVSASAGISVRPPAGGKLIRRGGGGDEVARFVNDEQHWRFVITRITLNQGVPLVAAAPAGAVAGAPAAVAAPNPAAAQPGFAESVAAQMPNETPGKFVRNELMPINGYDGAILASRYRESGASFLIQQAVIKRTDKHYYVLSYTTPLASGDVETQKDPNAIRAIDTFGAVLDTVEIIDQEQVARDQTDRLIRTRGMMVNWTQARLRDAIVPEQWLRLIKDGKDIGYSYVVEELANDLPRAGSKSDKVDPAKALGVRIGVTSRTMPEPGVKNDAQSWMWVNFDRGQEAFSNLLITNVPPNDAAGKPDLAKPAVVDYSMERGTSIRRDRTVPQVVQNPGGIGNKIVEHKDDRYDLQIWSTAKRQTLPPLERELPPYYLPQALAHLLPRIVPTSQAKTYMFASYVSDRREVMTRYVDVLPSTSVNLGGRVYTAIPIQEKIGLEGSVTTHYMTPDGKKYLGSVNDDNKITVVASDADTILRIWKDAELQRPAAVDDVTAKPATPAPAAR